MRKLIITLAGVIAIYYLTRTKLQTDINEALNNKNVQAFLAMIRRYESAGNYFVLYGGSTFSDTSAHPNVRVPFHNPLKDGEGDNDYSTAAGAYQINRPTWLSIQALAFLPDFSPPSQDEAAVWLLKMRGILQDVIDGNFSTAIKNASTTWASLPFSTAGQNPAKYQDALNTYVYNGGIIA